jgi:hypothetical protein
VREATPTITKTINRRKITTKTNKKFWEELIAYFL